MEGKPVWFHPMLRPFKNVRTEILLQSCWYLSQESTTEYQKYISKVVLLLNCSNMRPFSASLLCKSCKVAIINFSTNDDSVRPPATGLPSFIFTYTTTEAIRGIWASARTSTALNSSTRFNCDRSFCVLVFQSPPVFFWPPSPFICVCQQSPGI